MNFEKFPPPQEKEAPQNNKAEKREEADKEKSKDKKKLITRREALKTIGKATALGTIAAGTMLENKEPGTLKKAWDAVGDPFLRLLDRKSESREKMADHILYAYKILKKNPEICPQKIFDEDFFGAVRIEESNCDIKNRPLIDGDPKKPDDAFGLYQTRRPAIKDVPRFLELLHDKKIIRYDGPIFINPNEDPKLKKSLKNKYKGRVLKDSQIESMTWHLQENEDLSKAYGELYFMQLFFQYGIGKEELESGNPEKAKEKLLAAYHDGPTYIYKTGKIPSNNNVRNYIQKIKRSEALMSETRNIMKENGLNPKHDNIATIISRERRYNNSWFMDTLINNIKKAQGRSDQDLDYAKLNKIYRETKDKTRVLALKNQIKKDQG